MQEQAPHGHTILELAHTILERLRDPEAKVRELSPVVIGITGAGDGCASASGGAGAGGGSRAQKRHRSVEQVMVEAQARVKRAEQERDDAIADAQEEGQYSALFIDKQHQRIDALKQLCRAHNIEQHEVDKALNI